jgi:transposase-like protein
MIDVITAKTSELVAYYNKHSAKPITKFADRKTAERRVAALLASNNDACPKCGSTDVTCGTVKSLRGRQHVIKKHEALCHGCGHEFNYNTRQPLRARKKTDRGAAIMASWKDKEVAARRAARHNVLVVTPKGEKVQHKSVRQAFMVLALPLGQHIKFRGQLKASGNAEFGGFKFKLVDR